MFPISRSNSFVSVSSDPPGTPEPVVAPHRAQAGSPAWAAPLEAAFPREPDALPYAVDERGDVVDPVDLAARRQADALVAARGARSRQRAVLQVASLGCLASALAGAVNVALVARLLGDDEIPAPAFMALMSLSTLVSAVDALLLHRAATREAEPAHRLEARGDGAARAVRAAAPGQDAGVSAHAMFGLLTGFGVSQITSVRLSRAADFAPAVLAGSCAIALLHLSGDGETPERRTAHTAAIAAASTAFVEGTLRIAVAQVRAPGEQAAAFLDREGGTRHRAIALEDAGPPDLALAPEAAQAAPLPVAIPRSTGVPQGLAQALGEHQTEPKPQLTPGDFARSRSLEEA